MGEGIVQDVEEGTERPAAVAGALVRNFRFGVSPLSVRPDGQFSVTSLSTTNPCPARFQQPILVTQALELEDEESCLQDARRRLRRRREGFDGERAEIRLGNFRGGGQVAEAAPRR